MIRAARTAAYSTREAARIAEGLIPRGGLFVAPYDAHGGGGTSRPCMSTTRGGESIRGARGHAVDTLERPNGARACAVVHMIKAERRRALRGTQGGEGTRCGTSYPSRRGELCEGRREWCEGREGHGKPSYFTSVKYHRVRVSARSLTLHRAESWRPRGGRDFPRGTGGYVPYCIYAHDQKPPLPSPLPVTPYSPRSRSVPRGGRGNFAPYGGYHSELHSRVLWIAAPVLDVLDCIYARLGCLWTA